MKFRWSIVYVPDVQSTVDFYERGLGCERRFVSEDGGYAELETGDTRIGFAAQYMSEAAVGGGVQPLDPGTRPQAFEFGFAVDDVPEAFRRAVDAGATPVSEPEKKPWGQIVAYVRDLNGMLIEFGTDLP